MNQILQSPTNTNNFIDVKEPPSKRSFHVKWGLACLVALVLVVAIALVLYFTLPIALPAILAGSIGGLAVTGGLILWGIKGYQLGLSWAKYESWQQMVKNMSQEFIEEHKDALKDVRDFLFNKGDARNLEKSYEHIEVLRALKDGLRFVLNKVGSQTRLRILRKVWALSHWIHWAEECNSATRKKICRTILEPIFRGETIVTYQITDEHLYCGRLELPLTTLPHNCQPAYGPNDQPPLLILWKTLERVKFDFSQCSRVRNANPKWSEIEINDNMMHESAKKALEIVSEGIWDVKLFYQDPFHTLISESNIPWVFTS